MTHRVAQQVHDRIFQGLENTPVHLHTSAASTKLDFFPLVVSEVSDHLSIALEEAFGWHHARLPHIPLKLLPELAYIPGEAFLQAARGTRLPRDGVHLPLHGIQ